MTEQEIKLVDDHIEKHLTALPKSIHIDAASFKPATVQGIINFVAKLCVYFAAARPIIDLIVKYFGWIKPKWKTIITNLENTVDEGCALINPPA